MNGLNNKNKEKNINRYAVREEEIYRERERERE